jgi:hypothetical protein
MVRARSGESSRSQTRIAVRYAAQASLTATAPRTPLNLCSRGGREGEEGRRHIYNRWGRNPGPSTPADHTTSSEG